MAKNKPAGTRIFITVLVLALLLACGWFITSYRIEKNVEEKLHQLLKKHQLSERVQWQYISASPLGVVVFKNVTFQNSANVRYTAEKIRISDIINHRDRLRIRLQIIQGQGGNHAAQYVMQPIDMNWQADLNFAEDQGTFIYDSQAQASYDFTFHLDIRNIAVLRGMLKKWLPDLALSTEGAAGNTPLGLMVLSFNALDATVYDRRLAAQLQAAPETGVEKSHDIPQQIMQVGWQALQKGCAYALPEHAQSCQHLTDFVQGKKSRLHLTAQPQKPLPLWQFVRLNQAKTLSALNVRLE